VLLWILVSFHLGCLYSWNILVGSDSCHQKMSLTSILTCLSMSDIYLPWEAGFDQSHSNVQPFPIFPKKEKARFKCCFISCNVHHLYCCDFIRCMSDTLAWCRTERWNLSFLNLSSGSNWKFTGGNVYFFLGSARPLFSLPHQFLLLLSTSRSSPVMNESMFCSQSTSTQKVVRKRRGV